MKTRNKNKVCTTKVVSVGSNKPLTGTVPMELVVGFFIQNSYQVGFANSYRMPPDWSQYGWCIYKVVSIRMAKTLKY